MPTANPDYKGFACQCGPDNRKKMDDLRALAIERKQASDNPQWFVSSAIIALDQSYRMSLTWLATDQWGGMAWSTDGDDKEPFVVNVQWDIFEDGLAMVLDQCFQKWGRYRHYDDEEEEA